eukprot:TRINITY_DN31799_c0_g1_i1.p1 TRINITY_DN31799_c0_g1~~TRINITY_DN31799_c0_g1_i1.p1  ORF type:complete len:280 (+),score=30.36 TRINITY_DN31799_c0_g1_i1:76-840(+)
MALQLYVRCAEDTRAVEVSADATVKDLLDAVHAAFSELGPHPRRLFLGGVPLAPPTAFLSDLGVSSEAVVEMPPESYVCKFAPDFCGEGVKFVSETNVISHGDKCCVRAVDPLPPAGVHEWSCMYARTQDGTRGSSLGNQYYTGLTARVDWNRGWGVWDCESKFWGADDWKDRVFEGEEALHFPPSLNSCGCKFGSREVVRLVADMNNRTLTMYRDGTQICAPMRGLPDEVYPLFCPVNHGVELALVRDPPGGS